MADVANGLSSPLLEDLRRKAAALRSELAAVEKAMTELEQRSPGDADGSAGGEGAVMMYHRPSWSLLGSGEGDAVNFADPSLPSRESSGLLRLLEAQDADFDSVLAQYPPLLVEPIGAYNHWDRRECAVANKDAWRAKCEEHIRELGGNAEIPKVIHQIWVGPKEPPCLWIDTFRVHYLEAHPEWGFKLWSDEQVAKLPMINGDIYDEEKMWQCKADILRLEFLWHYGGLYVDADMVSVGNKSLDPIVELGKATGFVIAYEPDTKDKPYSILGNSVIACTPHHPLILMLILYLKQTYHYKRKHEEVFLVTGPVMYTKCLVDSSMPISIAAQELLYPAFHFVPNPDAIDFSKFPRCLMFQFGYTCSGLEGYVKRRNRCRKPRQCNFHAKIKYVSCLRRLPSITDAEIYSQVAASAAFLEELASSSPFGSNAVGEDGIAMFVTDGELVHLRELREKAPSFVDQLNRTGSWDIFLLGIEWSTGSDEAIMFNVPPGGRPRNSVIVAVVVNLRARNSQGLQAVLSRCVGTEGFDAGPLFEAAGGVSIWFGAQKYAGTMEEARIDRSMPLVHHIFTQLAGHHPPLHAERRERHGNLIKGYQYDRVLFEMVVENNGGIMFRSWNDDNSPNCELKTNGSKVEWMKTFYNHQVAFEAQNRPFP